MTRGGQTAATAALAVVVAAAVLVGSASGLSGTFLHFTDIHVDNNYWPGNNAACTPISGYDICCHNDTPPGDAPCGKWGDYRCDIPPWTVEAALAYAQSLTPKPDFIIWTGDNPPHDDFTQSRSGNLATIQQVTSYMSKYFAGIPVFASLGNHDTYPVDTIAAPPQWNWLMDAVGVMWGPWLDSAAQETFAYGGYYAQLALPGLRVVSLNTIYWDDDNIYYLLDRAKLGDDPAGQYAWLNATLAAARAAGEKVWLIGHIAPGVGEATEQWIDDYMETYAEYNDVIVAQLFGHTHTDQFLMAGPNQGDPTAPLGVIYVTPSITTNTDQNPVVRQFFYDTTSFQITNYRNYYANITRANELNLEALPFELLYDAQLSLGLPDLTPQSWQRLLDNMFVNQTLFDQYDLYRHSGVAVACDDDCRYSVLCGTQYVRPVDQDACRDTHG